MNEKDGQLRTSVEMRAAYMHLTHRDDFVDAIKDKYGLDLYTTELIWEVIDIVADLGAVRPLVPTKANQ
jgi:hypothetical protein